MASSYNPHSAEFDALIDANADVAQPAGIDELSSQVEAMACLGSSHIYERRILTTDGASGIIIEVGYKDGEYGHDAEKSVSLLIYEDMNDDAWIAFVPFADFLFELSDEDLETDSPSLLRASEIITEIMAEKELASPELEVLALVQSRLRIMTCKTDEENPGGALSGLIRADMSGFVHEAKQAICDMIAVTHDVKMQSRLTEQDLHMVYWHDGEIQFEPEDSGVRETLYGATVEVLVNEVTRGEDMVDPDEDRWSVMYQDFDRDLRVSLAQAFSGEVSFELIDLGLVRSGELPSGRTEADGKTGIFTNTVCSVADAEMLRHVVGEALTALYIDMTLDTDS